jgi:hypothetical protein
MFQVLITHGIEAGDISVPRNERDNTGCLPGIDELPHADRNPGQHRRVHSGGRRIGLVREGTDVRGHRHGAADQKEDCSFHSFSSILQVQE